MAVSITECSFNVTGSVSALDPDGTIYSNELAAQIGSGAFDAIRFALEDGTGDAQANQVFVGQFTLEGGNNLDLDMIDGTLVNFKGESIVFSTVNMVLVSVVSPDGDIRLLVGPQGVTDGAQLWFGGTGADASEEVFTVLFHAHPVGWTVGSGDSLVRLLHPDGTGADVTVNVIIVGVDES